MEINVIRFDHEGLHQLQNKTVTDEDLRGRNVYYIDFNLFSLLHVAQQFPLSSRCRSNEPLPNYINALYGGFLPVIAASKRLGALIGDLWTAGDRYSVPHHCDCSAHGSVQG